MSLEQLIALAAQLNQQPSAWATAASQAHPSSVRRSAAGLTPQEWAGLFPECAAPAQPSTRARPETP